MRWGYLVPRLVLLALVWACFSFAFDPLLRRAAIGVGRKTLEARLEIASLETSFFPPALHLADVRLADPDADDENLFEFGELSVELAGRPLLKKSYVVESGRLTGLRWSTSRSNSGRVERTLDWAAPELDVFQPLEDRARQAGRDLVAALTSEVRDRLDPNQLETVQVAQQRRQQWDARLKSLEARAEQLEAAVRHIEDRIDAKGNTLDRLQAYQQAATEAGRLLEESAQLRQDVRQLGPIAQRDFEDLDAARQRDLERIQQKLKLLRFDAESISEALFGPELAGRLAQAVAWLRWFRDHAAATEHLEPQRTRGISVEFARLDPLPKFLIRSLEVTGEADIDGRAFPFRGRVTGLTNQPAVYGQPTIVELDGEAGGHFTLRCSFDATGDVNRNELALEYSAANATAWQLGDPDGIGARISAERSHWSVQFAMTDERLGGQVALRQAPVELQATVGSGGGDWFQRIVHDALEQVEGIETAVEIGGTFAQPNWRIRSNLGEEVSRGLVRAAGRELESRRLQLEAEVDAEARRQLAEFEQSIGGRYRELLARLDLSETQARKLLGGMAGRGLDVKGLLRR